jgi:acyl-[acyl-carrier-protein] desaturase
MTMKHLPSDLQPTVATLLERHLENAKEWFPHEFVPWSRGRDFVGTDEWDPNEVKLSEAARVALVLNLLTEDNLPYYFAALMRVTDDGPWGEWTRRWTAEEGRHAIVIRDYLTVTRSVDPVALERGRMQQVTTGEAPTFDAHADALVYTTLQELATRISHRNTGQLLDDPAGRAVMIRVATDENLHHLFYRDVATEALARHPSEMVLAMERVVRGFSMPGTGIADFTRQARIIAEAGVYDFSVHYHQILVPIILQRWDVENLDGLTSEAATARDALVTYIARIGKAAARLESRRERAEAKFADA